MFGKPGAARRRRNEAHGASRGKAARRNLALKGRKNSCSRLLLCWSFGSLEKNSGDEGGDRGEKPFDPPELNCLKVGEGLDRVDHPDRDGGEDAAGANQEGNERRGGKAKPGLDGVKLQRPQEGPDTGPAAIRRELDAGGAADMTETGSHHELGATILTGSG